MTGRERVFCSLPKPEGRALVVPEREERRSKKEGGRETDKMNRERERPLKHTALVMKEHLSLHTVCN